MIGPFAEGIVMRRLACFFSAFSVGALACVVPALAQTDGKSPYKIEFDQNDVQVLDRRPILSEIFATEPRGGTAFRDAALVGVEALAGAPRGKDRAVVLMTDGADVNSTRSLGEVIAEAKRNRVRIYTVGIGSPGT